MSRRRPLVPSSASELEGFKIEIAKDLATEYHNSKDSEKANPSSFNVGGEMVKRMVKDSEEKMVDK